MEKQTTQSRSGYGSRIGLLCVLIAGSVGTGNMWRYPRLVCSYGGAFVIATVIGLILIALPLCMSRISPDARPVIPRRAPFATFWGQSTPGWAPLPPSAIL